MADQLKEFAEMPKQFVKEGAQFVNRCTKPDLEERKEENRIIIITTTIIIMINHSGRATSLIWLYQSGVDDTQVMTISGHKSLKGVRSYISPTIYQKASKISNVLQMALTLQESSTSNKTPQKNTEPEDIEYEDNSDELDDMSDKGSGVKSLG
ncbi:10438_t:CDS:2, partial [Entrophospora sp. SA101]